MESERKKRSYDGDLMVKGTLNEDIVIEWFQYRKYIVRDLRDKRTAQELDIDIYVQNKEGIQNSLEIKSDKLIHEYRNLFFEIQRINHFAQNYENRITLGWGWRSPASILIVRNPESGDIFQFDLPLLRGGINQYILRVGNETRISVIETDKIKTTIGLLIPMQAPEIVNLWENFNYLNNQEYQKKHQ